MVRRLLLLLVSTVAVLLAMSAPASAKAPPFTVELSDPAPSPGERVTVTVRMWDPADRSKPSTLMDLTVVRPGDLLGLVPAGDLVDGRPRAGSGGELVTLRNIAPATFRGSFVAPEDGHYRLVPFPRMKGRLLGAGAEGFVRQYPTTELAVQDGDREGDGWSVVPVAAVAALGATAALIVTQRRRRQLRLAVTP